MAKKIIALGLFCVVVQSLGCIKVQQKGSGGGSSGSSTSSSSGVAAVDCTSTTSATPNTISGLKAWLDANCITGVANNTTIDTWPATVGTSGTSPAANVVKYYSSQVINNSKPGVYYASSADDYLVVTPTTVLTRPMTIIIAGRMGVANSNDAKTRYMFSGPGWYRYIDGGGGKVPPADAEQTNTSGATWPTLGSAVHVAAKRKMYTFVFSADGTTSKVYVNGAATIASYNEGHSNIPSLSPLYVGNNLLGATMSMPGYYYQVLVYQGELSAADITTIYNYFNGIYAFE